MTKGNSDMSISMRPKDGKLELDWDFVTVSRVLECGILFCYIPGFDMYFNASSEEMLMEKGRAITKSYFDNYFVHTKDQSLKYLSLDLRKKGFKPTRDLHVMKNLVKNRPVKAQFISKESKTSIPSEFESDYRIHENTMALAV